MPKFAGVIGAGALALFVAGGASAQAERLTLGVFPGLDAAESFEYREGCGGVQAGKHPQRQALGWRRGSARGEEGEGPGPDDTRQLRQWVQRVFVDAGQ